MQPGNKVIANTLILYVKILVTTCVGLLTTRYVLEALGIDDYGLYNLIAGIIAMLSFFNAAMSVATQRFLSFAFGKKDLIELRKIFHYSIILHIVVSILIIILIEIGGRYLIMNILSISESKIDVAINVLHWISVSTFFSILAVPYIAILTSRENMFLLSLIDIIEAVLKLGIAIILLFLVAHKLILYASLIASVMCVSLLIKIGVCYKKYPETHISLKSVHDKDLLKRITRFTGWSLIGSVSSIARGQGIAVILNIFYGVVINAAYGIANQVNGLLSFFSAAIMQSIRPQIIKSEGAQDRPRMLKLSLIACRYMFFLCALFSIPLIIEMPYILNLWLKEVPEYTIVFCRLILFITLLSMLTQGLSVSIEATGKIKWLQVIVGTLHVINFPIGYWLLKIGYPPQSVLICILSEEAVCLLLRVIIAHKITNLRVRDFITKVLIRSVAIFTIAFGIGYFTAHAVHDESFMRLLLTTGSSSGSFILCGWFLGTEREERRRIGDIIHKFKLRSMQWGGLKIR